MNSSSRSPGRILAILALAGVAAVSGRLARTWGATGAEASQLLPGDELISADVVATRAISVAAAAHDIWPWLVQLGHGRGGFYSFDRLEQLVGLEIHSADRIVPEWQNLALGDDVDLAEGFGLTVARLEPERHLVLVGRDASPGGKTPPFDFSWTFVLEPRPADGEGTRLVVRERYRPHGFAARLMVEATVLVSWLMSAAMLRGVRDRAQGSAASRT